MHPAMATEYTVPKMKKKKEREKTTPLMNDATHAPSVPACPLEHAYVYVVVHYVCIYVYDGWGGGGFCFARLPV